MLFIRDSLDIVCLSTHIREALGRIWHNNWSRYRKYETVERLHNGTFVQFPTLLPELRDHCERRGGDYKGIFFHKQMCGCTYKLTAMWLAQDLYKPKPSKNPNTERKKVGSKSHPYRRSSRPW